MRDENAKAELKTHAQRVARLQRIRALAEKAKNQKLIVSIDEIMTTEEIRHGNAMNTIRTGTPATVKAGGQ